MTRKIICETHGESDKTYACTHLTGESAGLGFNSDVPSDDNPWPGAWCDNCEIIREAHGAWKEESEKLTEIFLLCAECYARAKIRNTKPTVTLDDLASLRWKCGSCEEWHAGPMLDIAFSNPSYWSSEYDNSRRWGVLSSGAFEKASPTFLDSDYCAVEDRDFFVRGIIHLPILGAAETFRWGVWGSLSRENFEKLIRADHANEHLEVPPMFSWLSNNIAGYPDTRSLKMYAHIQEPGTRPHFRLERCDHPLAQEYHRGISPERVREIMFRSLPPQQTQHQ